MSSITNKDDQERLRRNADKWTDPLMDAGWTVLPSVILERQRALGLDPIDVNILLQLARHWWYADNPPHPSKKAIAECLGIKEITVRRHIAAMEATGLIQRRARHDPKDGRQQSNAYLFDGLIKQPLLRHGHSSDDLGRRVDPCSGNDCASGRQHFAGVNANQARIDFSAVIGQINQGAGHDRF